MVSRDPPTTRLCAVRGLIRSDGSPRLDSVKAAPRLSDGDMDSPPHLPQDPPPLGKCRVKRADSRAGKEKTDSKCTKKPQKKPSIQATTWKACVPRYCSVCFMIVYQIDCVMFNRTPEPLEKPIMFVQRCRQNQYPGTFSMRQHTCIYCL